MSWIIAENVSHAYGPLEVLKDISFRVAESDRIGLVGPNGEGKTTLLRIVGGLLESTGGQVHRARSLRVGYLPQIPPDLGAGSLHETMLAVFGRLRQMERDLHQIAGDLEKHGSDPERLGRYDRMQSEFEAAGGYSYHHRIAEVLTGLGFDRSVWDRHLTTFSGGQRTRALLATLLVDNPDVLLLDEPTNHLDLDSVEWLETWLRSFRGALIVVSHDRYFLDRVTETTWELAFATLEYYKGPYSKYVEDREVRHLERTRQWEAQRKFIANTRDFVARFRAGQRSKQARGRQTRLDRFLRDQTVDRPRERQTINLNLAADDRTGDIVLRVENLGIGYDPKSPLLTIERADVYRGDRIAVVGANGVGKTTLLRTLLKQLPPLAGKIHVGANVKLGYLSQNHAELDPDRTALELVREVKKNCLDEEARDVLGSLLITGDDVYKQISMLSGGQRSRVALARLMMLSVNVLVLDEPTNHLDIPSTEIMQDVLQQFEGTILFVSHDRYLVQAVATRLWAIHRRELKFLTGSWDDFLEWRAEVNAAPEPGEARENGDAKNEYEESRKQSNQLRRLQRRHEELETEIEKIETELAGLNQSISAAGQVGNLQQVHKLGIDYQQKNVKLQALWKEWEEVSGKLE